MVQISDLIYISESVGAYKPEPKLIPNMLNEAYFGKKHVEKIQKAMDRLYDAVKSDPNIYLTKSQVNHDLEKAFCDVFGFKKCKIYWTYKYNDGGPCTIPGSRMITDDITFKHGTNKNGFYDSKHVLSVYICSEQAYITHYGVTSEEMVAMLLHEVGHNFDYRIEAIIESWSAIINAILDIFLNPTKGPMGMIVQVKHAASVVVVNILGRSDIGRTINIELENLEDTIANILPPIAAVKSAARYSLDIIDKLINAIATPMTFIPLIGYMTLSMPLNYLRNTFLRHGEMYADSFAASYGYSAEMGSALDKIRRSATQGGGDDIKINDVRILKAINGTILMPFYDLALLKSEIVSTLLGGHGSPQQRILRMADKFDNDLADTDLTDEDRREIIKEKERLMSYYDRFVKADEETKAPITAIFRALVEAWYNGKACKFVPKVVKDQIYAK